MRLPPRILGLFSLLAGLTGCGGGPAPGDDAPAPASVLRAAPADFTDFQRWAFERLQQSPAPVPMPAPVWAEPKWPVTRLAADSWFKRADKSSTWQSAAADPEPLAEIGPFDTRRPPANLATQIARADTPDGDNAVQLLMTGFRVQREAVGMIRIRMKLPFGEQFRLQWSKAGEITIPVATNADFDTYAILTDGFVEWEGPLDRIRIFTDGVAEAPIEIESIAFLPQADAYPLGVGRARARLEREIRDAVYVHAPATLRYPNVRLPDAAHLHTGLGLIAADADASATFRITLELDGTATEVFTRQLSEAGRWTDAKIDLAQWAGRRADVVLEVTSDNPGNVAVWGAPTIYQPVEDPPFVVIYLIDTLAGEHMDLHGYPRATMPNLSALARRGTYFPRMVSNSSRTVESVPDLLLGLTTERHGVHHNMTPAPLPMVSLADALAAAGFATASLVTNVYAGPRAQMDQGFETFVDEVGFWWTQGAQADRTIPLEATLHWIDQHADRPMFMYIHTAEPHAPYTPPPGVQGTFDQGYTGNVDGTYNRDTSFRYNTRTQADLQHVVALYDEEIRYADERLGLFLDGLRQRSLDQRLNLVLTADHGEEFLQHGAWEHGMNLHNEQTRVPLVMVGPLFAARGALDMPAQIVDVMPTLLDLLDLPQPYPLLGDSLSAVVAPGAAGPLPAALADRALHLSNHNYRKQDRIEYARIEGNDWKLIASALPGGPQARREPGFLLFDLAADPREQTDVLAAHPERARRMIEQLLVWHAAQQPYDFDEQALIDAGQMQTLVDMAYAGDNKPEMPADEPEPDAP